MIDFGGGMSACCSEGLIFRKCGQWISVFMFTLQSSDCLNSDYAV